MEKKQIQEKSQLQRLKSDKVSPGRTLKFLIENKTILFMAFIIAVLHFVIAFFSANSILAFIQKNIPLSEYTHEITVWYDYILSFFIIIFQFISKLLVWMISFYVAFFTAYIIISPFYSFFSALSEKKFFGKTKDVPFSLRQLLKDVTEALILTLFMAILSIVIFFINFIPVAGQIIAFLLYAYSNTLIFIDYAASRRGWPLMKKIGFLKKYPGFSFRAGVIPAIFGLIPLIGIFFMAIFSPFFVVYLTLNFAAKEKS